MQGPAIPTLTADRVFANVGTHATIPDTPGLREAGPMMHIEALDLQRRPGHLIVIGGGYVGFELGQTLRRLGSRVTLISRDSQLASNEDADVGQAFLRLFRDEDIDVPLNSRVLGVDGRSGHTNRGRNRYSRCGWVHAQHDRHRT